MLEGYDNLDQTEWRYLLTGGILLNSDSMGKKPAAEWVSDKMWQDINCLAQLPFATGFADSFAKDVDGFRPFFDASEPYKEFDALPASTPFTRPTSPSVRRMLGRSIDASIHRANRVSPISSTAACSRNPR